MEHLIKKWTITSPSFIEERHGSETLTAASQLWGPSPYQLQREKDIEKYSKGFGYKECLRTPAPTFPAYKGHDWGEETTLPTKSQDIRRPDHQSSRSPRSEEELDPKRRRVSPAPASEAPSDSTTLRPINHQDWIPGSSLSAEELTESDLDAAFTEEEIAEQRTAMEED